MADVIDYKILGDDMQLVIVELDYNEGVFAEPGSMMFMEEGIEMQTGTGGGLWNGFKRMLTGESLFVSAFYNKCLDKKKVAFAAPYPGKILPLDLAQIGGEFLCQRSSFLCAAQGINLEIAFTKKLGAGFFGGEGFILQRVRGDGLCFIHAGGTLVKRELQPGETLFVDTGCLVAFSPSVHYDIKFIGGFKNTLFGGEGLFWATLSGPGTVYLQSLPFSRLSDRIRSSMYSGGKEQTNGLGGLLGGLLNGDR